MRASINSLPHPGVATLMPLRCCRFIAADNRCASGVRAALPELVLIYEPLPITIQARHYATRGSIMTAACLSAAVYPLRSALLMPSRNEKTPPKRGFKCVLSPWRRNHFYHITSFFADRVSDFCKKTLYFVTFIL